MMPSQRRSVFQNSATSCDALLRAESEARVTEIIQADTTFRDPANWHPLDERETNFNVVTNQASTGSKALTELCTNMVDAFLMKQAYVQGVDPYGADAPPTVLEGVRQFAGIKGMNRGRLFEVDDESYLRKFARKNLVIGVTGGTQRGSDVCFTFVDRGEGQEPERFTDTFLSLRSGHKSKIPFVQGKYNMGSSGVLGYCGTRWYKLILSRRFDENGPWGWTLLRKRPGGGTPVAEFFAPGGTVPSFPGRDVFPLSLKGGDLDCDVSLTSGTVVKLYSYFLDVSPSFRNIRETLDRNLTSTILPFRVMDYRYPKRLGGGRRRAQGVDERTFCGLEYRLLKSTRSAESDEPDELHEPGREEFIGGGSDPELGRFSVSAILFDDEPPSWLQKSPDKSRVYHAVNGQVQYKQNRAYLSSTCKLPGIIDKVAIIVDASELTEDGQNDVWKGDRENIRRNKQGQSYLNQVTELIAESQELKEFEARLARRDVTEGSERTTKRVFDRLIEMNPSVAQILPGGVLIKSPGQVPDKEPFDGQYFPTFLRLARRNLRRDGVEVVLNQVRRVEFNTDVVNDFFTRSENRGGIEFRGRTVAGGASAEKAFTFQFNLRDGRLHVRIRAVAGMCKSGDVFEFNASMFPGSLGSPVESPFVLKCVASSPSRPPGPRPKPSPNPEPPAGLGAPDIRWLTKDGRRVIGQETTKWDVKFDDFGEHDGGYADLLAFDDDVPVFAYYVNYDNVHLQSKLLSVRAEAERAATIERFKWGLVLVMMSFEHALGQINADAPDLEEFNRKFDEVNEQVRRALGSGTSAIALALTDDISRIASAASFLEDTED